MGGQKWSALSGSIPLTSGEPQLALTSPAKHCPIPASGRQGTRSWSFPQGQLHTFGTRSQQPLPRDCFGAARAGWKAVCCLFSARHPLRQNEAAPPGSSSRGLWLAATPMGKPTHCNHSALGVKNHPVHAEKEICTRRTCTACRVWYKMGPDTFLYFSYTHTLSHTYTYTHTYKNIRIVYVLYICTHMHTQKQLEK